MLLSVGDYAAPELMRVRFPEMFSAHDGESAAMFLDRLRFPAAAFRSHSWSARQPQTISPRTPS